MDGWADEVTDIATLAVLRLCPPANRQDMRRAVRVRYIAECVGNMRLAMLEDGARATAEVAVAANLALAISAR